MRQENFPERKIIYEDDEEPQPEKKGPRGAHAITLTTTRQDAADRFVRAARNRIWK
jgi:hypothetical protein